MSQKYIKRKKYLKEIKEVLNNGLIKVIVGQRRVGKTYLLLQIIDLIKAEDKKANIIYLNKEYAEYDKIKNYTDLLKFISKNTKKTKNNYVLIDEVQEIVDFEKALRSIQAKETHDIYCTGSNAKLISSEIATLFAGRYYEVNVFSLCYKEFLIFNKLKDTKEALQKYLLFGGLPYLKNLKLTEEIVFPHIDAIYNTILFKDIAERHKIRNFDFLERLIKYLAVQTGSVVSANKIADFLKSQKTPISTTAVLEYLEYLRDAFFIYKVSRLNVVGKKIFEINEKYYFSDLGLRHTILGYQYKDRGRIMENAVYLHLLYLGYKIKVGVIDKNEIDFVAEKDNETLYVQVAYQINEDNHEREFGNLLKVQDNYRKMVISEDSFIGHNTYKGIEHMHIREFLLS